MTKVPDYIPDWQKLKKDAEKTPKRTFTNEELNSLTATIIGESGSVPTSVLRLFAKFFAFVFAAALSETSGVPFITILNNE